LGLITRELFTYLVTKTRDGTCGLVRIGYSPLLRQSLLAGNKPLKEAKGRFKISIDALYYKGIQKSTGGEERQSPPLQFTTQASKLLRRIYKITQAQ
jgi:hypothetical protein